MSEDRKVTIASSVLFLLIKLIYGIHVGCFVGMAAGACIGTVEGAFSYLMSAAGGTEYGAAAELLPDFAAAFVGGTAFGPLNTMLGFFAGMLSGAGIGGWGGLLTGSLLGISKLLEALNLEKFKGVTSVFNSIFGGRTGAVLLAALTSSVTGFVVQYLAKKNPNDSMFTFGFLGLRGGLYVGIAIGLCFAIYGYNKSSVNLSLNKAYSFKTQALGVLLAALLLVTLFEFWGIIPIVALFWLLKYGPESTQEFLQKNVISKATNKKWILILSGLAGAIGFKGFLGAIFGVLTGLAINRWLLPELQNPMTKVDNSDTEFQGQ